MSTMKKDEEIKNNNDLNNLQEEEEGTKNLLKRRTNINTALLTGSFEELFEDLFVPESNGIITNTLWRNDINDFWGSSDTSNQSSERSDSSGLSFDIDINPRITSKENQNTSSETDIEQLFKCNSLSPQSSRRTFKFAGSEKPTCYVTAAQVTNNYTPTVAKIKSEVFTSTTTGTSLLDLSLQSMSEHEKTEIGDKGRKIRKENHAPKTLKKYRTSPYPTPPTSDDDSIPDFPSSSHLQERKNGHIAGYNRKTGEQTLVGKYPPLFKDGTYTCPNEKCRELTGKDTLWTTKNGYKYHLLNNCLQNPESVRSIKLMNGGMDLVKTSTKSTYFRECACGAPFISENGFRLHQESNESTKEGRCIEKARKKDTRNPSHSKRNRNSILTSSSIAQQLEGMVAPFSSEHIRHFMDASIYG